MRLIQDISDSIRENIEEAEHHIDTAYRLKSTNRNVADWYKSMALSHLDFNNTGHAVVKKAIDDYKSSGEHSELAPGMMAVYDSIHADLIEKSEKVRFLIEQYGK